MCDTGMERAHWMKKVNCHKYWTVNFWCKVVQKNKISPHFFKERLTEDMYKFSYCGEIFLHRKEENVDSPRWHAFSLRNVQDTLNRQYRDKLRKKWLNSWPPRSLNLIIDYFITFGGFRGRMREIWTKPDQNSEGNADTNIKFNCWNHRWRSFMSVIV